MVTLIELLLHSSSGSSEKDHKKSCFERRHQKTFPVASAPGSLWERCSGHILSKVGREAQPHWDYSCESWSRIDFSVTSFMLMVVDNEDYSYECLKLFHWEVTESKSTDKWKGDKNL